MKWVGKSDAYIVFCFFCAAHDIIDHFVESVVLVVKGLVLELEVLELLVLVAAVALKQLSQVVHPLADLFVQLLELSLCALLQFF